MFSALSVSSADSKMLGTQSQNPHHFKATTGGKIKMKKAASIAFALLAILALSGGPVLAYQETIELAVISEQNNSGQSGSATLTRSADGSSLTVEIEISGGSGVAQPAHIHRGSCENLDPKPFVPLNNVVNGRSVTVITDPAALNVDYGISNQYAINVHKSAAEASVYVACGNLGQINTTGPVGMPRTGSGDVLPTLALLAMAVLTAGTVLTRTRSRATRHG
jgi:hypothetical protein